jgi:ParB family chromosome partitioning protein
VILKDADVPTKRPALGKGLSALIPEAPPPPREGTVDVDIDRLHPNPRQPRTGVDDARLDELARSIRSNGVIQPIVARRSPDGFYEIVAGERRWRAAQRAGLLRVPVIVRDVPDEKLLEVALIENIQREDLNPIEEAYAYRRLGQEYDLTQDQIADAVGKDRSSVANTMRLLRLPEDVRALVASGQLSMGHARALLALPSADAQRKLARAIVDRGLSVRETEAAIRNWNRQPPPAAPRAPDVHVRAAEERLKLALGTRVRIVQKGAQKGRIEIDFTTEDELQRLFEVLTGK